MSDNDKQLVEATNEVINQLVASNEPDEIKRLTQMFNVNQMKKDAIRVARLNDMLDKLDNQVLERIETQPDQFSNRDLIDYLNTIQNTITKSTQNVVNVNQAPLIQLNQTNNVVNVGEDFNRESRSKIIDVVQQFLELSKESENIIDVEQENEVYYNEGE